MAWWKFWIFLCFLLGAGEGGVRDARRGLGFSKLKIPQGGGSSRRGGEGEGGRVSAGNSGEGGRGTVFVFGPEMPNT